MGPYLFTRLLMPILSQTAATAENPMRIVNVSSDAYSISPKDGILFDDLGVANSSTMFAILLLLLLVLCETYLI